MTNIERLKEMDADELSSLICDRVCAMCIYQDVECRGYSTRNCRQGIKDWLESEAEND